MPKPTFKTISFILVSIATILLVLDLTHLIMVFKTEKGLLDFLPPALIEGVFIAYPIFLFISYFLFFVSQNIKDKFHSAVVFLLFLNGFILLSLLIIYFINPKIIFN